MVLRAVPALLNSDTKLPPLFAIQRLPCGSMAMPAGALRPPLLAVAESVPEVVRWVRVLFVELAIQGAPVGSMATLEGPLSELVDASRTEPE